MPFLKPLNDNSVTKSRIDSSKINGLRKSIFTHCLSSTRRYTGEWRDDKKHGKGSELIIQSSLIYEGDWANNLRHGYGVLSKILKNSKRRKIYSGYWVKNKKDGFGGFWYINGNYYEGYFSCNKKHGFGRMWNIDGSYYQGTWKNDLRHGQGILVLANGNRYEGNFTDGKREGRGIYYHTVTGQLQDGYWLDDNCVISTMEDTYWRQSAVKPTAYPIPKSQLKNSGDIIESEMIKLNFPREQSSSLISNSLDYRRGNVGCLSTNIMIKQ